MLVWSKPSSRLALWAACPECLITWEPGDCHICHNHYGRRVQIWKWLLYARPGTQNWLWLLKKTLKVKPIIWWEIEMSEIKNHFFRWLDGWRGKVSLESCQTVFPELSATCITSWYWEWQRESPYAQGLEAEEIVNRFKDKWDNFR